MIHCRQGTKRQLLRSNSVQSICCLMSPDATSLHSSVAFYTLCTHIYLLLRRQDEVLSASGLSVVFTHRYRVIRSPLISVVANMFSSLCGEVSFSFCFLMQDFYKAC